MNGFNVEDMNIKNNQNDAKFHFISQFIALPCDNDTSYNG